MLSRVQSRRLAVKISAARRPFFGGGGAGRFPLAAAAPVGG